MRKHLSTISVKFFCQTFLYSAMKSFLFSAALFLALQLGSSITMPAQSTTHNIHQGNSELLLKSASGHAMQYYVSLPKGWTAEKKWRILVVVEAAEKEYKANAMRFVAARGSLPYIIVAPFIVTNGNAGRKDPTIFPYSDAEWEMIEKVENCAFDIEGLEHVIKDLQKQYNGEEKVMMTGFEAGTHLVWTWIFTHPEQLVAAVPVSGNYIGRCVDESHISKHSARIQLPVHAFYGEHDTLWGHKGGNFAQWERAKQTALKNGYTNISEEEIHGKGHVPLPEEIISYFTSLLQTGTVAARDTVTIAANNTPLLGNRIAPYKHKYVMTSLRKDTAQTIGSLEDTFEHTLYQGKQAGLRICRIELPNNTILDSGLCLLPALTPIYHRSHQTAKAINLNFNTTTIRGTVTSGLGTASIQTDTVRTETAIPIFDSYYEDIIAMALVQKEGLHFKFPEYIYERGGQVWSSGEVGERTRFTDEQGKAHQVCIIRFYEGKRTTTFWVSEQDHSILQRDYQTGEKIIRIKKIS
jgi:dienelactone hydrolase